MNNDDYVMQMRSTYGRMRRAAAGDDRSGGESRLATSTGGCLNKQATMSPNVRHETNWRGHDSFRRRVAGTGVASHGRATASDSSAMRCRRR